MQYNPTLGMLNCKVNEIGFHFSNKLDGEIGLLLKCVISLWECSFLSTKLKNSLTHCLVNIRINIFYRPYFPLIFSCW